MSWWQRLFVWLMAWLSPRLPKPPEPPSAEPVLRRGDGWRDDTPTVPSTPSTATSTTTAPAVPPELAVRPLEELEGGDGTSPEALDAALEEDDVKELRGKSVFIRQIKHLDTSPIEAARKFAGWGFAWCAPMITTSDGRPTNRQIEFYRELHKLGVGVVPDWIRPKPGTWQSAIDDFFEFVDRLPFVTAVMFDPEEHWRDRAEDAARFADAFRERARQRGLKVVLTTYAMPPKDFPMEEFAEVSDAGICQTYYITSSYGDRIFELSLARWRARGFADKPLVLGAAFWQKYIPEPRTKTVDEWAEFLAKVPPTPGLVVWPNQSWGGPVVPLLELLKDWQPRVVPPAAQALLLGLPFGEMIANGIFGG